MVATRRLGIIPVVLLTAVDWRPRILPREPAVHFGSATTQRPDLFQRHQLRIVGGKVGTKDR